MILCAGKNKMHRTHKDCFRVPNNWLGEPFVMMNKRNPLFNAVHYALATGVAFGMSATGAFAQDQDEDTAELDRIEVTGSRIKRADIESASPVFVIQREEIERTGLTSIGDLLQDLPVAGAALNTQFNNGGNGATNLDLRNLGSNRLLVLLNGRRFATSLGGAVDLNNIPVAVIKRIEVLKDGASSVYGSDAISGVVNVITRDDFEGMQANAYFGQFESENDGEIQSYDFSVGTTSDRGSVFFNASYTKNEPVFAGDRRISAVPQFGTGNAFGSAGTPQGLFIAPQTGFGFVTSDAGANVTGPGGVGAAAFRPFNFLTDPFNFAPDNYILTPQERYNVFTQGVYDVTDDIRLSVEGIYNKRKSDQLLAPTPLFVGGLITSGLGAQVGVGALNPFNPFGSAIPASSFGIGRRMVEAGRRNFVQDVDYFRFGGGLEGSFQAMDRYFDWDVGYLYNQIDRSDVTAGLLNIQRVIASLSDDCVTGAISGCVPLNVFGGQGPDGQGTITPAMIDYITFVAQDERESILRNYTANLTGEIFEMPAGPLGFAVGYEYRQVEGFDQPDALITAGITSGNARLPTRGSDSVDEFYVELAIPLLSGVTGAERLDLSLSTRWSDYDSFGDTTNSKVGLEWQPIDDLLIRGTWSEGFRAPSIAELFAGQGDSFPTIADPCSGLAASDFADPSNIQAQNCAAAGVPTDGSYTQPNPQIRITTGSNPNLNAENSESYTFGFVYSPSWLDGLDLTVDYYNIEVENVVTTIGSQFILSNCTPDDTVGLNPGLCQFIERAPNGLVTDLFNGLVNGALLEVEGVDFLASYSFPETDWGFFRVVWDSAYQGRNEVTTAQGDLVSSLGFDLGDGTFPRWKSNLDLNWSFGDWEATWGMQYIHGTLEDCDPDDFNDPSFDLVYCDLDLDSDGTVDARGIGGATYHDAQVSYHLSEYDTRFTLGVQNIGDKGPPLSVQAFANSFNAADHRVPGRFPYVRVTVDF